MAKTNSGLGVECLLSIWSHESCPQHQINRTWWYTPVIRVLGGGTEAGRSEVQVIFGYIASWRVADEVGAPCLT